VHALGLGVTEYEQGRWDQGKVEGGEKRKEGGDCGKATGEFFLHKESGHFMEDEGGVRWVDRGRVRGSKGGMRGTQRRDG
jgi:hypothetical protein